MLCAEYVHNWLVGRGAFRGLNAELSRVGSFRLVDVAVDAAGPAGGQTFTYHLPDELSDVQAGRGGARRVRPAQRRGNRPGRRHDPARSGDEAGRRPESGATGRCCRHCRWRWPGTSRVTTWRRRPSSSGDARARDARSASNASSGPRTMAASRRSGTSGRPRRGRRSSAARPDARQEHRWHE